MAWTGVVEQQSLYRDWLDWSRLSKAAGLDGRRQGLTKVRQQGLTKAAGLDASVELSKQQGSRA